MDKLKLKMTIDDALTTGRSALFIGKRYAEVAEARVKVRPI